MSILLLVHHHIQARKNKDQAGCLVQTEIAKEIAKEDAENRKDISITRVVLVSMLLFVPLVALSPIWGVVYLFAPQRTLFFIWRIISGVEPQKPKTA